MSEEHVSADDRRKCLYLLDGANLMFRAYHAIRNLTNSKGFPTNALYGFTGMLLKLIRTEEPDLIGIVFDASGPTFRDQHYEAYKATRAAMPEDLVPQVPYIHAIAQGFRIPFVMREGFEADDIIATLTRRAQREGYGVCIVSSDKDLAQLVGDGVTMLDTMADRRYDPAGVREKWGVAPEQMRDYLALVGDTVDNIPGVTGIGPKTACELLQAYGTLEGVYEHIGEIKGRKRELLEQGRENAFLSRRLVGLDEAMELDVSWQDLHRAPPDRERLTELFRELEFKGFLREFHTEEPVREERKQIVLDRAGLDEVVQAVRSAGRAAVMWFTDVPEAMRARVVGLAVATDESSAWYIPAGHSYAGAPRTLSLAEVLEGFGPVLSDPAIEKTTFDYKLQYVVTQRGGGELAGVAFDVMLASYVLDAGKYAHTLSNVALDHLDRKVQPRDDAGGRGRDRVELPQLPIATAGALATDEALCCLQLTRVLSPRLDDELRRLLDTLEMPLSRVLAAMERHGVLLDRSKLGEMSHQIGIEVVSLEREIRQMAGVDFVIGSPKQLAEVLFDKLGLPKLKRTKTGVSTDSSVLEKLCEEHPICQKVLDWRALTKLKSTYVDVLPGLVDPSTGRIHTAFNQAVAATGRLSSSNPNIQNIPIRSELGRTIRGAFIAPPGHVLLSADYSQIELRLLGHLAEEATLCQAFRDGADIHRRTAAEVMGVALSDVTPEMRRRAKAINFGILYGMSAFRLSRDLGISRADADAMIERYFASFPGVRRYLQSSVEEARRTGHVHTILGRRRALPDIHSKNHAVRGAAERMATNTPIQGSAADLIKLAMVRLHDRLLRELPRTALLLQVHDELLLEVPEDGIEAARRAVTEEMVNVMELRVPLEVDVHIGRNWSEAHG